MEIYEKKVKEQHLHSLRFNI